jgi:plastocyanin
MSNMKKLAVAALVIAAACGGGGASNSVVGPGGGNTGGNTGGSTGGSSDPVATTSVSVGDNIFTPSSIVVSSGATVTWTWAAGAGLHNVTFNDGTQSGDKSGGATFTRTFSTAGTFNYACTLHVGMTGTVKVN